MSHIRLSQLSKGELLIGAESISFGLDDSEQEGVVRRKMESMPNGGSVEILCELEAGEESQLAELLAAVLLALQARLHAVVGWSLRTTVPRYGAVGPVDFVSLFKKLPPCRQVRLSGFVGQALAVLPPAHRDAVENLELCNCGSALTTLDVLRGFASLKSIEISDANNVCPPWTKAEFEGFLALKRIKLPYIPKLQPYRKWITSVHSSISRKIPIVEIGDVQLPQVETQEELGDHVRFVEGIAFAKAHWFPIAPSYLAFEDARDRGATSFTVPAKCHVQMLSDILGSPSKIQSLDCQAIENLGQVSPDVWMPEKLGLDAGSARVEMKLPALRMLWNERDPQVAQQACDGFIESLVGMMQPDDERQLLVVIDGPVSTRLRAWKWLLDQSEGRLTLALADNAEPLPAPVERGVSLDLSNPSHEALCRLLAHETRCRMLAKLGVRAMFLDRLHIVGSLYPDGHKLLEQVFNAVPGLELHIDAQLTGGAEWLMGSFAYRALQTGRRVTLSAKVQERVASLDLEKREYEGAAAWALREVGQ